MLTPLFSRGRSAARSCAVAVVVGCLTLLSGCSRDPNDPTPVTGQVLVEGRPAVGATVSFHPVKAAEGSPRPVGQVDAAGNFRLTTRQAGDGAPPGEYKVTVTWYVRPPAGKRAAEGDEQPARNQLSQKYAKPESTPLTATIIADQTEPLSFNLNRN